MHRLTETSSWIVGLFLFGLFLLVMYRIVTGQINTRYLLFGRNRDGTRFFSPERVQLLLFSIWVGLFYLLDTFETRVVHPTPVTMHTLPEVGAKTLALVGGSQGIYLVGKIYSLLIAKSKKGI